MLTENTLNSTKTLPSTATSYKLQSLNQLIIPLILGCAVSVASNPTYANSPDIDGDGIINSKDYCPMTPLGQAVATQNLIEIEMDVAWQAPNYNGQITQADWGGMNNTSDAWQVSINFSDFDLNTSSTASEQNGQFSMDVNSTTAFPIGTHPAVNNIGIGSGDYAVKSNSGNSGTFGAARLEDNVLGTVNYQPGWAWTFRRRIADFLPTGSALTEEAIINALNEPGATFTTYEAFVGGSTGLHEKYGSGTVTGFSLTQAGCALKANAPSSTKVEAEDYMAAHDNDAVNHGGGFNAEGVDIESNGSGYNVFWIEAGEWLEFDVMLDEGVYDVQAIVASDWGGGSYSIEFDGNWIGSNTVDPTGGWQSWQAQSTGIISPSAGMHTVRVNFSGGNFNFDSIKFISLGARRDNLVRHFEAEHFEQQSGTQQEDTADFGGGKNVGWIDYNDWMLYPSTYIQESGWYTISYRVASNTQGGGTLQFEEAGGWPIYGSITVPNTGGWQNWQTISHDVYLEAGSHNFAIASKSSGWNINWFEVIKK